MSILVTGGAGFIGSHFVKDVLASEQDGIVVNLDKLTYAGNLDNLRDIKENSRHIFVKGDIINAELVKHLIKAYEVDAIVNFAAESHVDRSIDEPDIAIKSNVLGTHNLLEAARGNDLQFLQVSTDEVYGEVLEGERAEHEYIEPSSPYSAAKASADLIVKSYARTYGLNAKITRGANNYGPNQYPEKLIALATTNLLEGKKVPVYGDGQQMRDWIFVKDHCDAIRFVMENGKAGEFYNIASGTKRTNLEVIQQILSALGKDKTHMEFVTDRPGHDRRYSPSVQKLFKLGWQPKVPFETGIQQTIDWYKNNEWWWKPLKEKMKSVRWLHGNK